MGIDIACSNGNVYTWHSNGMVSIGDSDNLGHRKGPQHYEVPHGKKPTDIQAISIKHDVTTYYSDGTYTLGNHQHLDNNNPPHPVRDGVVQYLRYDLPRGKRPTDIVGISHNCGGEFFIWFKDGTGVDGKGTKFTYHVPPRKKFTDIVEIGISKSGDVYTWYKDSTVSIGTAEDLGKKRAPYRFHHPYD